MIHWLYRYVFRGIGILLLVGMITFLILAVNSHIQERRGDDPVSTAPHP